MTVVLMIDGLCDDLTEAGLEPGEIAALRWGDVDWLRGRLNVDVTLIPGPQPVLTNSSRPRAVTASWDLLRALEAQRRLLVAAGAGDGDARFVFPNLAASPAGGMPTPSG